MWIAFVTCYSFQIFAMKLPEHAVNGAEICSRNTRLHFNTSSVHSLVLRMNNLVNMQRINSVKISYIVLISHCTAQREKLTKNCVTLKKSHIKLHDLIVALPHHTFAVHITAADCRILIRRCVVRQRSNIRNKFCEKKSLN